MPPLLDLKEIDIEIARLEYGESSYPAYAQLTDLNTNRNQMDRADSPYLASYAQARSAASSSGYELTIDGDSEILQAVSGRDASGVWSIIDDLMDTLHAVNPRVYAGVMRIIYSLQTKHENPYQSGR